MRYKCLAFSFVLWIITLSSFCQTKQYLYYFDKDLNHTEKEKSVFNGIGATEDSLFKLILVNASTKQLVLTEHFKDSTLQEVDGLFQSYYKNVSVELEGDYFQGKEDGLWQRWDSLGLIIDSSVYDKGEKIIQGTFSYYQNGSLQTLTVYNFKTGMVEETAYDESGKVLSKTNIKNREDTDIVFTKVEVQPSFPGGAREWTRYISRQIQANQDDFDERDYGTCLVRFIVGIDGKVTNVVATTMQGSHLAKIAIHAILYGPKWIPALQNGRPVRSYRIQPVTISNMNKP